MQDPEAAVALQEVDRRKIANDARTAVLGENPKARREQIRATLPDGFYICASGKRGVRRMWIMAVIRILVRICLRRRSLTWSARSVRRKGSAVQMNPARRGDGVDPV